MPTKRRLPRQPGVEGEMTEKPKPEEPSHRGSGKLQKKVAIITGADSGIGRAVAIAFAKEGADVVIVYLDEHKDAKETKRMVEEKGRRAVLIAGDVGDEAFCRKIVKKTLREFDKIDVHYIFAMFYLTRFVLTHLRKARPL